MIYTFDGTFEGLLTAVFESFNRKEVAIQVFSRECFQPTMFDAYFKVESYQPWADRVWKGLLKKMNADWQQKVFEAFLMDTPEAHQHVFNFIRKVFQSSKNITGNYGDESVLAVSKAAFTVSRECMHIRQFVRFQQSNDGLFLAKIEPVYNILPLVVPFFRGRYADQPWLIYDIRRDYGMFYDTRSVTEVQMQLPEIKQTTAISTQTLHEDEALYETLWTDYFKSTTIQSRLNRKLQLRHMPRRYWKYLPEKGNGKQ